MARAGFRQGSAKCLNDKYLNDGYPAGPRSGPVAECGLYQRQRRHRRGVGAQDPRPQRKPQGSWLPQQDGAFFLGKPAFGADQDVGAVGRRQAALQRLQRIFALGGLVAENQQAPGIALAQITIERDRVGDRGNAQDAALLGRLDDIGPHPLAVDPADLGEAGQHRLQRRCAHLDRFLHHVVEPGVFQRRKDVSEVRQAILRPGLGMISDCRAVCGRQSWPAIRHRVH
jgi:hypothetical protein